MPTEVDDELKRYTAKPPSTDEDELQQYAAKPAAPADDLETYLRSGGSAGRQAQAETPQPEQREVEALPGGTARLKRTAKTFQPPTRFEKEAPAENFGYVIPKTIGEIPGAIAANQLKILRGGAEGLKNVYGFGKELLTDLSQTPGPGQEGWAEGSQKLVNKYLVDPQLQQAERARQLEELSRQEQAAGTPGSMGHAIEAVGHRIAAGTPMVGPWIAGHAERLGTTGDIPREIGAVGGEAVGGKLGEGLIQHPEVAIQGGKAVVNKLLRGMPMTEAGKLAAAKEQIMGVKPPGISEVQYAQMVEQALPDLARIAQENQGKVKDTNPRAGVQLLNKRIGELEGPIREQLQQVPDTQQAVPVQVYQPGMEQAIDQAFRDSPSKFAQKEIAKAKAEVFSLLEDQDTTERDLDKARYRWNNEANDYFHNTPADQRVEDATHAVAVARKAAADWVRDHQYGDATNPGSLEQLGIRATDARGNPVNLRDVRLATGRLLDIRNHFEKAITRAETTGDWSMFQVSRKGPSLAAGGAGVLLGLKASKGPFGALLGMLTGEGLKAWADYRYSKNPNLLLQKAMENLRGVGRPNTYDVTAQTPPPPVPAVPFRMPASVQQPAPPPPVPAAHMIQPTGTVTAQSQLGMRGQGGVRPIGALPAPATPVITPTFVSGNLNPAMRDIPPIQVPPRGLLPMEAAQPEATIPPGVEEPFGREEVRPLATAEERRGGTQLGTMGRGGIRQEVRGELPEMTRAEERVGGPGREGDLTKVGEKEARGRAGRPFSLEDRINSTDKEIARDQDLLRDNPDSSEAPALRERIRQNQEELRKLQEQAKKKEPTVGEPEGAEPIPYTKTMPGTERQTHHHELGHAIIGGLAGFDQYGIVSNRYFPNNGVRRVGNYIEKINGGALFDLRQFREGGTRSGPFRKDLLTEKANDLSDLFAAGAAANEIVDNIPRHENRGIVMDRIMANQLFEAMDIPKEQWDEAWNNSIDRAKAKFTPEVADLIKQEATRREENLPVTYHYSRNRVAHILDRVRSIHEGAAAGGAEAGGPEAGYRGGEEAVAGREGQGPRETAVPARPEKLKAFKPPKNTYTIEVRQGDNPPRTITFEAADRKKAFAKAQKLVPYEGGHIREFTLTGEKAPEVQAVFSAEKTSAEPFKEDDVRVSPRVPSAVKAPENGHTTPLQIDLDSVLNAPTKGGKPPLAQRLANTVRQYPGMNRILAKTIDAKQALNKYIDHMADNLTWMHNQIPEATRQLTRQWYDSANTYTRKAAEQHGVDHRQSAGVMASQSPQKDWDMNVSLHDRILDTYKDHQDTVTTPEMKAKMKELDIAQTEYLVKEEIKLQRKQGRRISDAAVEQAKDLASRGYRQAAYDKIMRSTGRKIEVPEHSWKEISRNIDGKSLGELPADQQAGWIRAYDEAHNPRQYKHWSPDGSDLGFSKNADGSLANVAWGSFNSIEKAINILRDGSRLNISKQLGNEHKVRSFYNNIIDPNSEHPDVTVDTHAVAAAQIAPHSGQSTEVMHNFGGPGSSITGSSGTYPLYAEAYRRAAQRLGLKPRELQSMVWEQVRELFPDTFKTKANQGKIASIWKDFGNGKLSLEQARNKILETARGQRELGTGENRASQSDVWRRAAR